MTTVGGRRGSGAKRVGKRRRKKGKGPGRARARGPRVDITRGVRIPVGRQRFYDPPHRSLSEGRGLPHTPLIKAMLPVMVLLTVAALGVVVLLAAVASVLG